ncbi:MAG: ComEC/Rec2 family competence protein [Simkaniaceae bacterium]|nr:ComEC/Rec2 family competence protein [Candidatus Sacchlamyda saccharinae]
MLYVLARGPVPEALEGRGIFQLEKIQRSASPFGQSFALKGKLMAFEGHSHVPCVILQKKLPAGARWIVKGRYEDGVLKCSKGMIWQELKSHSLVRWRFASKERVRRYFHKRFSGPKGHFFASIATGDPDDRLLAMEFRKVGLGHILAISGFHFALVAGMLGVLLHTFFPRAVAYGILLVLLGGYYVFLGFSPSVLRAFLMIGLFTLGKLLRRQVDVFNLLGIALLFELALDPRIAMEAGFQLSFFATLGILSFYRPILGIVERVLPKYKYFELEHLSRLNQHGYLLSSWIRKGVALNLAVHLVTMPISLYVFGSFPLLSLGYNLVIPPFLALSMALIPFGVLLPPLGVLNGKFTAGLLNIIGNPPELLHFQIFSGDMPFWVVMAIVTLLGAYGLQKRQTRDMIMGLF